MTAHDDRARDEQPAPAAREHLVNAAAPAMRTLMNRVARQQLTPDEAVDVLLGWPDRAPTAREIPADELAEAELVREAVATELAKEQ